MDSFLNPELGQGRVSEKQQQQKNQAKQNNALFKDACVEEGGNAAWIKRGKE